MLKKFITSLVSAAAALSLGANAVVFAALPIENAAVYDSDEIVTFIVEVEGDALLASDAAAELGTDYIETQEAQEQEAEILKTQARVLSDIQSEAKVKEDKGYTYTAVLNGFSIDAPRSKMEEIEAIDGVTRVTVAEPMEVNLANAVEMTSSLPAQTADETAETGYTGEGQVIAIIDSEFDLGHEFFSTAPANPSLSKSDVADILDENTMNVDVAANQVYKSEKIPFAYDYVNNTADTYASNGETIHGTHVAGIAAGSGGSATVTTENGEGTEIKFSGVAPEAQIVLMKISAADGSLDDSTAIAALDDAVKLGVCAVNMSFGSDYLSLATEPIFSEAFDSARNAGVMLLVSAGNAGIGYNSSTAAASTPDYSTSGVPSSAGAATAVASMNNSKNFANLGTITAADNKKMYYKSLYSASTFGTDFDEQTLDYVDCGYGTTEDFESVDVSGKIALIERGEITFTEKSNNAKAAGAVGLIVYNTSDGISNFITSVELSLPAVMIEKTCGEYLKNAETKTITVTEVSSVYIDADNSGILSSFTAMCVDETLDLKPEITAPGGSVYSSIPNDQYGNKSGTSMAAPHMTGVAALMNEYLDKNEIDVSGAERVSLIENMLMSSADVIEQPENTEGEVVPYSPRVQGAGLVNTAAAMKTSAIFIGSGGKSKLSLGDGIDDSFTLDFTVKNITDGNVTYDDISLDVLTDGYQEDEDGNYYSVSNNAVSLTVKNIDLQVDGESQTVSENNIPAITISAGSEVEVSITVTLDSDELEKNSEIYTNGFYIDGFVTFAVSGESDIPTISMPYAGFYGDWTSAPIFDNTMYDEGGSVLYDASTTNLAGTYLYSYLESGGKTYYYALGADANGEYNKDMIAISPNGDGMADSVGLAFTPWRAVKNLTLELTGGDFDIVRTSSSVFPKYTAAVFGPSELKRLDELGLPDGEYTLTVSGEFNYDGAEPESFELPVTIDRVAPEITGASIDGNTLYVSVSDNNYLYFVDMVYTDASGEEAYKTFAPDAEIAEKGGAYTAEFDISGLDTDDITIVVYDTALNLTEIELSSALGTVVANMYNYNTVGNMTAATVELYNSGESTVDGDAVIAFYDEDGALIAVSTQSVSIGAAETVECDFEMFADTQNAASAKLFIWDGISGMCPQDVVKGFDLTLYNY